MLSCCHDVYMKRAQIQLEEDLFETLRSRAFREKRSIAAVIRDILKKDTASARYPTPASIQNFRFVAAGRSRQGALKPVSEKHDEALAVAFKK